jgi:hypothetical protein
MTQGSSNKPKTKENQFLNPWDYTTLTAYLKDLMANPKIEMDEMEKPLCYPAFLFDPMTNPMKGFGSANPMPFILTDGTTPTTKASVSTAQLSILFGPGIVTESIQYVWNNANTQEEMVRTPTKWFNALISANGSTTIWTSQIGKKARLMGIRITLVNGTTAAAACLLKVLDVAADTGIGVQICGAALAAVGTSSIIVNENYGNGYLMAATNTAININLSSALAVAGVHVQVWGTEE